MPVLGLDQIDAVRAEVDRAWLDREQAVAAVVRFYRTLGMETPCVEFAPSLHSAVSLVSAGMDRFMRTALRRFRSDNGRVHNHEFRQALSDCSNAVHDLWFRVGGDSARWHDSVLDHFPPDAPSLEIELEELARTIWIRAFSRGERLQKRLEGRSPLTELWQSFRPFVVTPAWTDVWPKVCALECFNRQGAFPGERSEQTLVRSLFGMASIQRSALMSRRLVVVCDAPRHVLTDATGRPHSLNGPALKWSDGIAVHAINGCWVPQHVVVEPQRITLLEIELEPDESVQARLINMYGLDRYLHDSNALVLDRTGSFELLYKAQATCDALLALRNTGVSEHHQQCVYRVPASVVSAADALAWLKAAEFTSFEP